MKKVAIAAFVLASVLPATAVLAQHKMDDMKDMCKGMSKDMCNMDMGKKGMGKGMEMGKTGPATAQASHMATGVVKKLNPQTGVVTIAHGPVNSLNWPPMTMGFKLRDKALLAKLKEGQKVNIEFVQEGDDYVVTSVK